MRLRRARGFTLAEMLAVLVIIVILATLILRQVVSEIPAGQATALAQSLRGIQNAVVAFRTDVRRYPSQLIDLSTKPSVATDLCSRSTPASFLANWSGPYLQQVVTSAGLPSADATILNTLQRVPTVAPLTLRADTIAGVVFVRATPVDSVIAAEIEKTFDGTVNFSTGSVRWSSTGDDTLSFGIPIVGC